MASISEFLDLWEAISEPFFVFGVRPTQKIGSAEPLGSDSRVGCAHKEQKMGIVRTVLNGGGAGISVFPT